MHKDDSVKNWKKNLPTYIKAYFYLYDSHNEDLRILNAIKIIVKCLIQ